MKERSTYKTVAFCWVCLFVAFLVLVASSSADTMRVYVGTYNDSNSQGIYRFDLNLAGGQVTDPVLAAKATNAGFLEIHPSGNFLYATGQAGLHEGDKGRTATAYAIKNSGDLKPINTQPTKGVAACHLTVGPRGKNVLVASYDGGTTSVLPIRRDGGLATVSDVAKHTDAGSQVNARRQGAPHPHSVNVDRTGRFAFVADLGIDKVKIFRLDADAGTLTPNSVPHVQLEPGGGPRHFHMHPSEKFAYSNNELTNTVAALTFDPTTGALEQIQSITTLPDSFSGTNTTAEVRVHPSGDFLYVSNRGHESLAIFQIDPSTGRLSPAGHTAVNGVQPRNFCIDPTGSYLIVANQETENVVVFRVNKTTGALDPTGQELQIPRPVCIRYRPL
ncbi:MAG: lactonase family protein [Pirellulaceae bacterium]|nr:lactonase family protein [Pirellulaceae bacterium]